MASPGLRTGRRDKIPSQLGPNAELRLVPNSWNGASGLSLKFVDKIRRHKPL